MNAVRLAVGFWRQRRHAQALRDGYEISMECQQAGHIARLAGCLEAGGKVRCVSCGRDEEEARGQAAFSRSCDHFPEAASAFIRARCEKAR